MMSSCLSFLFLLQLGHAAAGSWADQSFNNGTVTFKNETVTSSTSLLPTASPTPPPIYQFHVGITRAGRRYQTGKRYWAFSGNDAIVTDSINDAAWFHYEEGYLKSEDKYVNIDGGSGYSVLELSSDAPEDDYIISKDENGNLELTGDEYTVGEGHGIFCASDDGSVFVIASKRPPFRCHAVNLRSKGPTGPPKGQQSQQGQTGQTGQHSQQGQQGSSSSQPGGSSHANDNGRHTLISPIGAPDHHSPRPNRPSPNTHDSSNGGEDHAQTPNSPPTGNTHNHNHPPSPTPTHPGLPSNTPIVADSNHNGGDANTNANAGHQNQWTDNPTSTQPSPVEDDDGDKDQGGNDAPPRPDPSSDPDPDTENDAVNLIGAPYWGDA